MRISRTASLFALAIAISLPAAPALAQSAAQEPPEPDAGLEPEPVVTGDTIVVFGTRLIGRVDAPQPPLLELGAEEISGYGAGSIAELLDLLAPQVGSSRGRGGGGRPVILVNGTRISSFRELRSYPPEAIERMEVFPEEVAQRYGYSPDQRVVNFILKNNYSSREIEMEYGQPWAGGNSEQDIEGTYVMISGPSRLNFNLGWENSSMLTEAERGIIQSETPDLPGDPDPARYRSLASDDAGLEATANWTTRLDDAGTSLSVNGTFERENSRRLQGLDTVTLTDPAGRSVLRSVNPGDPLSVRQRQETYALGSTLDFNLGEWQVTGTVDGSHNSSRNLIAQRLDLSGLQAAAAAGDLALDADLGTFPERGLDEALTKTDRAAALVTARGNPIELPAGDVSVTFDAGYDWNRIRSEDTRRDGGEVALTRGDLTAGVNIGIPLTSRDDDVLGAVGDVSLNLAGGLDYLSDFGTLYDWSAGVVWGVTDSLSLSVTYMNRDSAPTLAQLGNPEIATPNVFIYDFARNETVLATAVTGGNALLPAQNESDWKIGLAWDLPILDRASFSVDYVRNHSENVASDFPVLTPEIEAAFPGRVTRDPLGRLMQVDQRPVTFAEQDVERLQFGLNLSGALGSASDEGGGRSERRLGTSGSGAGGPGAAGPGASGPRGDFDPQRFAALRQLLCGEGGSDVALRLARGESVTGADGEAITLPPMMRERLAANGEPDPQQVEQFRERMCSNDGAPGAPGLGAAGSGAGGPPQGGAGGGGPRFGPRGGGGGAGRWFLNLQYSRELKSEILVAPGGPLLDLLSGDALSGGGQPGDTASLRLGGFYRGFGGFLNGKYSGSSRLEGSGLPGSTDLFFDDIATVDMRLFVDFGQQASLIEDVPLLDNTRLSFSIDNLFDARQRVTDSNGDVPLRYQPFLVDPMGRTFEIELRKLF